MISSSQDIFLGDFFPCLIDDLMFIYLFPKQEIIPKTEDNQRPFYFACGAWSIGSTFTNGFDVFFSCTIWFTPIFATI